MARRSRKIYEVFLQIIEAESGCNGSHHFSIQNPIRHRHPDPTFELPSSLRIWAELRKAVSGTSEELVDFEFLGPMAAVFLLDAMGFESLSYIA